MRKVRILLISAIAFLITSQVPPDFIATTPDNWLTPEEAEARSRGSRSRGGSFSSPSRSRSSSPSRSSGSRSSPSRSTGSSSSPSRSTGSSSSPSRSTGSRSSPSQRQPSSNTGGRVRGGSFDRKPSPSPSPTTTTSPSRTRTGTTSTPNSPRTSPSYSSPSHRETEVEVEINVPPTNPNYGNYQNVNPTGRSDSADSYNSNTSPSNYNSNSSQPQSATSNASANRRSGGFPWGFVFFLLIAGGIVGAIWYAMSKQSSTPEDELSNDVVTVSKLQVALLAEARELQNELAEISLSADLDSREGLTQFLQETALALLRKPEYWSYAFSSSQTVKSREEAQQAFEQLSIGERSKFDAETFTNVNGRVRHQEVAESDAEIDPSEYIVVTLLVGTEDDQPLFGDVYSAEDLKAALTRVASITPDYLLVYELLWSPEGKTDSLTSDELLTEYGDMVHIA